jgi:hypothetical protein
MVTARPACICVHSTLFQCIAPSRHGFIVSAPPGAPCGALGAQIAPQRAVRTNSVLGIALTPARALAAPQQKAAELCTLQPGSAATPNQTLPYVHTGFSRLVGTVQPMQPDFSPLEKTTTPFSWGATYIWCHIHMVPHTYGATYIWCHIHMVPHTYGATSYSPSACFVP